MNDDKWKQIRDAVLNLIFIGFYIIVGIKFLLYTWSSMLK